MPKISVILCVYNGAKYINECLQSLAMQTYKDFEIVLVNDGSTDETDTLIKEFISKNECNVKYVFHENVGLTKSLNIALDMASGEYIARMDADDICHEKRFEESINYIENEKLDFISTKSFRFFGDVKITSAPNINKSLSVIKSKLFWFGNPFVHGTFFFKRSISIKYKYDEEFRTAQDYAFLASLSLDGSIKMGYLNKELYYLRVDPNSSGRSINSNQVENAISISKKYFGSDKFLIVSNTGIKKVFLSIIKRLYL